MRKQLRRAILVTGTVAAVLGLGVPAALASGGFTGGPNFTWMQARGATFTLNDTSTGTGFTCMVSNGAGTVTGSGTLSVTSSSFGSSSTPCKDASVTATFSRKSGTTATISGLSFSNGMATVTMTGVDEILTITSPFSCTTEVKGTAGGTYTNIADRLAFTTAGDNLTVANSGCAPFANGGDSVTLSSSSGVIVTGSPNPVQVVW